MEKMPQQIENLTGKEQEEKTGIDQAIEILGAENVYGPEKIAEALGKSAEEVPEIPFSTRELEMMRDNNEHLELEVPNLTMEDIQNIFKEKADTGEIKKTGGLRFLNDKIKEKYFSKDKTVSRWIAVSNKPELATSKTAPIQLKTIIDTLETRYGGELPDKYKTATRQFRDEFAKKVAEAINLSESEVKAKTDKEIDQAIYDYALSDEARKKLVSWLENSKIAKMLTPTVTVAFYSFAIRYLSAKSDGEKARIKDDYKNYFRIFQSTSSDGLAGFGILKLDGVNVGYWDPANRRSGDGVSFSRS